MAMPVVCIWEVRMRVDQGFVPVPMAMFGAGRNWMLMRVLVVFIVDVLVIVFRCFMRVPVLMALGQVQPGT